MPARRRHYRPPVGLPDEGQRRGRWHSGAASVAVHALVIILLAAPVATTAVLHTDQRSLGWLGRIRGGGAGGPTLGERLRYVETAPPAVVPPPRARPQRVVLRRPPPAPAVVAPPLAPPVPAPPPLPPAVMPSAPDAGPPSGGGGAGAGPGTNGGAGAGTGPGVGSAIGPGAGGTPSARKIKAVNTAMTPPSLGAPPKDRPFHLVATFEVSPRGDARLLSVTKSKDGGFNERVRDDLSTFRFRPATLPNGTAVADTVQVSFDY